MDSRHALVVNMGQSLALVEREFVWPIQRQLPFPSKSIPLAKLTSKMVQEAAVVIFSGCPLADNAFVSKIPKFKWLAKESTPLLGICAGQQLLASIHGGTISKMKEPVIGVHLVKLTSKKEFLGLSPAFNAYSLHGNTISLPRGFTVAAKSAENPHEIIFSEKWKRIGVAFHPEVMNKHLFASFCTWATRSH